ncbi:MAG: xanthine dehydrogenase family protein molybdopterin-binding subunit [Rhodospirillaceae bacterium]
MSAANGATGWIGRPVARSDAARLAGGRGLYTDDIAADRALHVAFVRSPFAHARIGAVDIAVAAAVPGVAAVLTGRDLAAVCAPWQTRLAAAPAHVSPPQPPLAVDEAAWQGEAVVAVVAATRAVAEDAAALVEVDWQPIDVAPDPEAALAAGAARVHSALSSNLALDFKHETGDVDAAFAGAAVVVAHDFAFGRQTGVPLEPRTVLAAYDARTGVLTVHHSHQTPFVIREVFATQLALAPDKVRIVCPDVGGAFGIKLHAYADELAVAAIARLLARPVRYAADRLEAFVADVHAREATVRARAAADADGRLLALEVDALFGFGAYSCYPRGSIGEAIQAVQLAGAPYDIPAFRGRARGAFQNKPPTGAYRAVGQPIACAVGEQMLDLVAARLGLDALEVRRRNYRRTPPGGPATPVPTASGALLNGLSLDACLDSVAARMDYAGLRRAQAEARARGVWRGIGLSTFVELTAVGAVLYNVNRIPIAAGEGARLTLDPSGRVLCETSATDQGQGTRAGVAQVVADTLGVDLAAVAMGHGGDTASNPYGGGAWASRGITTGGEAALQAARVLRARILAIAAAMSQLAPDDLAIVNGTIRNADGLAVMSVGDVAAAAYYRGDSIPLAEIPSLTVERHHVQRDRPYVAANGIQAAHVEVDAETGMVRVLGFWVVEDCGRVVNPLLVDEQIRGGAVQGIGAALFEECVYEDGQLVNGTLADYLVPMAAEMPDIDVGHVETPWPLTALGAKGAGEAGTVGAPGAIWCAVNDALRPLGAAVTRQPMTPEHVLEAVANARKHG